MTAAEISAAIVVLDACANRGVLEMDVTVDGIQTRQKFYSLADLRSRIAELKRELAALESAVVVTAVRRIAFAVDSGLQ